MAGLLDWLAEGLGGGGGMPPGLSDSGMAPQGPGNLPFQPMSTAPMPPVQPTGSDIMQGTDPMTAGGVAFPPGLDPMTAGGSPPNGPGLPFAPGTDPMLAGGEMPNGPGLPPGLPAPRPTDASAAARGAPGGSMSPTEANGIYDSYKAAGGGGPVNIVGAGGGPQAQSPLGRPFGLDQNAIERVRGSLGSGLKAAGENAHKPGLAAFAGSAGSAIEGGQKADDKTTDKQDKYLARAIAAKREGNNAEYQKNYLHFQIENAKAKLAAETSKATGKNSVLNSPEQLYLRAIGATNQDAGIKISANTVKEAQKQFGPDSKEAKAALAEHEKRIQSVRDTHLTTLGVDPKTIKGLAEKPGFSDKNPVKDFPKDPAAAQKAFDALPEGAYFINPKDGRLLTKKTAGGTASPNPPQSAGAAAAPLPPMPASPMAPQLEEVE